MRRKHEELLEGDSVVEREGASGGALSLLLAPSLLGVEVMEVIRFHTQTEDLSAGKGEISEKEDTQ